MNASPALGTKAVGNLGPVTLLALGRLTTFEVLPRKLQLPRWSTGINIKLEGTKKMYR